MEYIVRAKFQELIRRKVTRKIRAPWSGEEIFKYLKSSTSEFIPDKTNENSSAEFNSKKKQIKLMSNKFEGTIYCYDGEIVLSGTRSVLYKSSQIDHDLNHWLCKAFNVRNDL